DNSIHGGAVHGGSTKRIAQGQDPVENDLAAYFSLTQMIDPDAVTVVDDILAPAVFDDGLHWSAPNWATETVARNR
ncbi:MAG: hypothetical protein ACI9EF_003504, partial [Pseudohongiellaceae bacterium]